MSLSDESLFEHDNELSVAVKLRIKQEKLRLHYQDNYMNVSNTEIDLEGEDQVAFSQMCRWHSNSHITKEEWLEAFKKISPELGTKENMDLSPGFTQFLSTKFKNNTHLGRFCLPGILEFLETYIRSLYQRKLDEREPEDEFDCDNVINCRRPEDTTFYERGFLPAAVLATYRLKHPNFEEDALWDELFTLGSGSKTEDLFPETNPVCVDCASVFYPNLKAVKLTELHNLNAKVFKLQKDNLFKIPGFAKVLTDTSPVTIDTNAESIGFGSKRGADKAVVRPFNPFSEDSSDHHETFSDEVKNLDDAKKISFNPFSSDESENEVESKMMYSCPVCVKSFSLKDYLSYHNQIFHKKSNVKSLVPQFVSDAEDLITTFVYESPEPKKKTQTSKEVEGESGRKFNLRNRSRRNLKFDDQV